MAVRLLAVRGRSQTNSFQRMNNVGSSIILNIEERMAFFLISDPCRWFLLGRGLHGRCDMLGSLPPGCKPPSRSRRHLIKLIEADRECIESRIVITP